MSKFNFNIDIENDSQSILKSTYNSKTYKELYEIDKYTINLDLPSCTLWCKYNLGVDLNKLENWEDWFGDYYAWGETNTKTYYDWQDLNNHTQDYKWADGDFDKITKYCTSPSYSSYGEVDYLVKLLSEDDVAYKNMHISNFKFHIPTKELFEELLEYTTYKWIENYQGINRLDGILFTGKNGNELFFPASGYQSGKSDKIHYNKNNQGHYWSSNLVVNNPYDAWAFNVIHDHAYDRHYIYSYRRALGFTIRPTSNLK